MATQEDICDSGYQCLFKDANTPDFLKCSSCATVSRDPQFTTCCSTQFCGHYLRKLAETTRKCPACGEDLQFIPNRSIYQHILKLDVFCTMKEQGCTWEGVIEDLHEHENVCEHVYVQCPQNCGQQWITRGSLDKHMKKDCPEREYTCPYCNYKDSYKFVTNAHFPECSYKPVECPNKCGVKGERGDMETHLCPVEFVPCKFRHIGCTTKFRRDTEAQHMKGHSQQHLDFLGSTTSEMSKKLSDLTAKNEFYRRESEQMKKKVEDLITYQRHQDEQMKKQVEDLIAHQHYRDEQKEKEIEELKIQLEQEKSRLDLLEKQVGNMTNNVRDDISPPEHSGDSERHEIRELERRSNEKDREVEELHKKLKEHETESNEQNMDLKCRLAQLEKCLNNPDPVILRPQEVCQDDQLTFTLKSYSTLKEAAKEWSSNVFPAFENGPRLKVLVWPNGQREGKDTHVSVWLEREVELEDDLEPFQITLTLQLIGRGHSPIPKSVTKSFIVSNNQRYLGDFDNKFIAHSDILQYLDNDSLKFQITCKQT